MFLCNECMKKEGIWQPEVSTGTCEGCGKHRSCADIKSGKLREREDVKPITVFKGAYVFMSNFYYNDQTIRGVTYPTNEHFYQSSKTLIAAERAKILGVRSGAEARNLGRRITIREDWDMVKLSYMLLGLKAKFSSRVLAGQLKRTRNAELVEGNWWNDTYWGIDLKTGCGKNMMGKLLMLIRDDL